MMEEMKIGEEMAFRAVESKDGYCTGCTFDVGGKCAVAALVRCTALFRSDKKEVIFVRIDPKTGEEA